MRVQRLRIVVAHEAQRSGGLGAEIAASVTERCFDVLTAPVARVTGFDVPYPPAKVEEHFLPDLDRILDAVDRVLGRPHSLSGVTPTVHAVDDPPGAAVDGDAEHARGAATVGSAS